MVDPAQHARQDSAARRNREPMTNPTSPARQDSEDESASAACANAECANVSPLWWLYLLSCRDGRTYVGIALDVDERFKVHLSGKGARFTRSNPPLQVLGARSFATKSEALKAEIALKKLDRTHRLEWARTWTRDR
jgi:putative endonuclease